MAEEQIYKSAYAIHQKYADRDLANDGHGIWQLSGDCLKQLVIPYDQHPLAFRLMQCMIDYYSDQYNASHAA